MTALPAKTTLYLILEAVLTGLLISAFALVWTPEASLAWFGIGAAAAVLIKSLIMFLLWDQIVKSLEDSFLIHRLEKIGDHHVS